MWVQGFEHGMDTSLRTRQWLPHECMCADAVAHWQLGLPHKKGERTPRIWVLLIFSIVLAIAQPCTLSYALRSPVRSRTTCCEEKGLSDDVLR